MSKIEISFEKGGVFTAELLEAEAPKTCAEFKKHLPFTLGTTHSTCAGQAAFIPVRSDFSAKSRNG